MILNRYALSLVFGCALLCSSSAMAAEKSVSPATQSASGTEADNTEINKRDRSETAITADEQKNAEGDVEIVRLIRKELVGNESLSTYAHNIKVVSIDGNVTLKGPVRSTQEKATAENIAKSVAGVSSVKNQLSVAK